LTDIESAYIFMKVDIIEYSENRY